MYEKTVVNALQTGDKAAFKWLFERYYDRLMAYVMTYTHDRAWSEDVVQQAFIDLWNDRQKLDAGKSPKNYLYAIAHNRYIDSIKDKKRREKILDVIWERALEDRIKEDNELLEKRIDKMKRVITDLPPKCKEIIELNKIQGIKYKDIAIRMGISVKTVEAHMGTAFKKIRKAFKDNNALLFFLLGKLKLRSRE